MGRQQYSAKYNADLVKFVWLEDDYYKNGRIGYLWVIAESYVGSLRKSFSKEIHYFTDI